MSDPTPWTEEDERAFLALVEATQTQALRTRDLLLARLHSELVLRCHEREDGRASFSVYDVSNFARKEIKHAATMDRWDRVDAITAEMRALTALDDRLHELVVRRNEARGTP